MLCILSRFVRNSLVWFALVSSWSAAATDNLEFDQQLRNFLSELIKASIEPEAVRASEMRRVLIENTQLMKNMNQIRDPALLADSLGASNAIEITGVERQMISDIVRFVQSSGIASAGVRPAQEILTRLPDQVFNEIASELRKQIDGYKPSKHPAFQFLLDPNTGISVSDVNLQRLVEEYLPKYFDSLSVEDKGRIASRVITLPHDAPIDQKVSAALQSGNVLMQKLIQLIGKEVKSPILVSAMARMQSDIEPFPTEIAREIIEKNLGRSVEATFESFPDRPMAAGTIGQTYKVKLRGTEDWVALKVRRPGARDSIERDVQVLLRVVDDMAIRNIVERTADVVRAEADFRIEAQYLAEGTIYIDEKKGITVAKQHEAIQTTEEIIATRLASGKNLSKLEYSGAGLHKRATAIQNLMRKWFRHAVFGSGFFHGDLHPGNLFLDEDAQTRAGFTLTLIDFGNSGKISITDRQSFAKIAASSFFGDINGLMIAFKQLDSSLTEQNAQGLRQALEQFVDRSTGKYNGGAHKAMEQAVRWGVQLSGTLVSFSRAQMFLEYELETINQALLRDNPQAKTYDARQIYISEGIKAMFAALPWTPAALSPSVMFHAARSGCSWLGKSMQIDQILRQTVFQ
jgi:predicted unusual protein kinase regulating ubiquinone biosynthesis (AarF/ABC1/UbiB family)